MACGLTLDGKSSSTATGTRENEEIIIHRGTGDGPTMVHKRADSIQPASPPPPAGKASATTQQVEHSRSSASCSSKDKDETSGSSTDEATEGAVPHSEISPKLTRVATRPRVTFDARLTTAVWPALSGYDRTSIVVDLSKTPFALFRKDAVLMAKAAAATTTPECCVPPSPAPLGLPQIHDKGVPALPSAADANDGGIESPRQRDATRSRLRSASWDYESDSSSAVTDTETCSETDSIPCLDRWEGGGLEEEGPAFYGVWKRTSSEGYDALLLSSGVPKRAIAMALRKHPVHIIDHDGAYFRLIVKNGLSKADNTFFIGDEPRMVSLLLLFFGCIFLRLVSRLCSVVKHLHHISYEY